MYALALLLAMFISALHAGILFSLGDFLRLLLHWARPTLGEGRPTDILVVLTAISALFVAHIAEASMWAAFFWKSGHLASFSDGWYFAGVSHTALGYGDIVLSETVEEPRADLCDQRAAYLRMFHGRSLPGAANGLAPPAVTQSANGESISNPGLAKESISIQSGNHKNKRHEWAPNA